MKRNPIKLTEPLRNMIMEVCIEEQKKSGVGGIYTFDDPLTQIEIENIKNLSVDDSDLKIDTNNIKSVVIKHHHSYREPQNSGYFKFYSKNDVKERVRRVTRINIERVEEFLLQSFERFAGCESKFSLYESETDLYNTVRDMRFQIGGEGPLVLILDMDLCLELDKSVPPRTDKTLGDLIRDLLKGGKIYNKVLKGGIDMLLLENYKLNYHIHTKFASSKREDIGLYITTLPIESEGVGFEVEGCYKLEIYEPNKICIHRES